MRIGRVAGRLAIIDSEGPIDVARASDGLFDADPDAVFPRWEEFLDWAHGSASAYSADEPLAWTELQAPVLAPAQVFGIGLNYREHAAESGVEAPTVPPVFTVTLPVAPFPPRVPPLLTVTGLIIAPFTLRIPPLMVVVPV